MSRQAATNKAPMDRALQQRALTQLIHVESGLSAVRSDDYVLWRQAATPLIASAVINLIRHEHAGGIESGTLWLLDPSGPHTQNEVDTRPLYERADFDHLCTYGIVLPRNLGQ